MKNLFNIICLLISISSYSQSGQDSLLKSKFLQPPSTSAKDSVTDTLQKKEFTQNITGKYTVEKDKINSKKDSLFSKITFKLKLPKLNHPNFLTVQKKIFKPIGSISFGYEYGVLPFITGDNYPSGGFKTEGNISFLVLNFPIEFSYYYTNIKNVIGLTNYFRLSYDAERYKEQLKEKVSVKDQLNKDQLGKLQLQQQELLQKMEYVNFLKQNPNYNFTKKPNLDKPSLQNGLSEKKNDSMKVESPLDKLSGSNKNLNQDSLHYKIKLDSINKKANSANNKLEGIKNLNDNLNNSSHQSVGGVSNFNKDSIPSSNPKNNNYFQKKDSINREYNLYRSKYDKTNKEIDSIKRIIYLIENPESQLSKYTSPFLSKTQRVLSRINKLEIGLCHPTNSTFLVNNIPLQGINIEYGKANNFLSFCYGTTISYLLYNPNSLQNSLQGTRNLFNYFDFSNLSSGRKVLSLKGGLGAKDDSHIYVGFLLGKGQSDYFLMDNSPSNLKESNLVLEVDAKYKFSERLSLDFIFGKSSIQEEDVSMQQIKKSINEIFSNYRSIAFLTRINSSIKKTKTKLTFMIRWVDPFFKSYGIGFLRSDNLRYEIKAEQPISNRIKYTIMYKREEDNLLRLYTYKNTIQTISNTLNFKVSRQLNIRLIYSPLFRELKDNNNKTIINDRNNISTVILSYSPRHKNATIQFNLLYSKYIITGDSSNFNFENLTFTNQILFKSGFKTDINLSWFKNNLKDTTGNDTYLGVIDIGYLAKNKNSILIGGKIALKDKIVPQYGFLAKVSLRLYKGLFWEAEIQKIIIGEYYNSFILENIKSFPYFCNAKLILNF